MIFESLFQVWIIAATVMLGLWLLYLFTGQPAVVDVGWGASIGIAGVWLFLSAPEIGARQWFLLLSVLMWSGRLTYLLLSRMWKGQVDTRYEKLSESWGESARSKYFVFFQAQAVSVAVLVIPIALGNFSTNVYGSFWDLCGILFFLLGISGEAIADWQMARFRGDAKNKGQVCQVGLWRYSRHPNYFFEWLIWVSYALCGMNHPLGLIGWVSPLLILVSILKITGIPPTEERLLATRGSRYREYQRTTSAFVPWPPKQ
jgi:steroid 5-alpha reductase family enzyme